MNIYKHQLFGAPGGLVLASLAAQATTAEVRDYPGDLEDGHVDVTRASVQVQGAGNIDGQAFTLDASFADLPFPGGLFINADGSLTPEVRRDSLDQLVWWDKAGLHFKTPADPEQTARDEALAAETAKAEAERQAAEQAKAQDTTPPAPASK